MEKDQYNGKNCKLCLHDRDWIVGEFITKYEFKQTKNKDVFGLERLSPRGASQQNIYWTRHVRVLEAWNAKQRHCRSSGRDGQTIYYEMLQQFKEVAPPLTELSLWHAA